MKAWHFVGSTLRDGSAIPPDGETLKYAGELAMCERGLHASVCIIDALEYAPGETICRVECGGDVVEDSDKLVCSERTILWRVDGEELLREFACQCALEVAHLWDMPDIVREYLKTRNKTLRAAAREAICGAARGAARGASMEEAIEAARAAARKAAREAALGAAWESSMDKAMEAARAAARSAARKAAWAAAMEAAWATAIEAAWAAAWTAAGEAALEAAWAAAWAAAGEASMEEARAAARSAARVAQNVMLETLVEKSRT